MNRTIVRAVLSASLVLAITGGGKVTADTRALTAIDMAEILMQSQGTLDQDTIVELLTGGITANMRVPPEHLGVAFWNSDTGDRLDRQEIRELVGPVRQDGVLQLLDMAMSMSGGRLVLDTEQLEPLLDAAFMASMRRPPEHISIEYYDRRQGPTGQGGGVSGRVPDGPVADVEPEPVPVPQSPTLDEPASLPDSEAEFLERLNSFGFVLEERPGRYVHPIIFWTREADEMESLFNEQVVMLSELGFEFDGLMDSEVVEDDDWVIVYALGHFEPTDSMTRIDRREAARIHSWFVEHLE